MSAITEIAWTDRTWNPVRGCSLVSEGCRSCYAMKQAHRFSGPGKPYEGLTRLGPKGPTWTGEVRTIESALLEPLSWRKPSKVFVNSMSDLFHEDVPDAFIDKVFAVMARCSHHTFQVLTKRPARMLAYLAKRPARCACSGGDAEPTCVGMYEGQADPSFGCDDCCGHGNEDGICVPIDWPLPNVWLGVSVENQHFADERIPLLLQTPAAVRFISAEPLLGPVDLTNVYIAEQHYRKDALRRSKWEPPTVPDAALDWVIVGGESGPGARPMDLAWARSIVQQCKAAGVACFVKQLGAEPCGLFDSSPNPAYPVGRLWHLKDRKGGDMAEWPEGLRVREFPGRDSMPSRGAQGSMAGSGR